VLVVNDELLVRMLVVDVLVQRLRCHRAGDGPQAPKVLRSDARIDLLITDVGLPNGMNGRQVADAARELRPGLKCCSSRATRRTPSSTTAISNRACRS